MRFLLLLITMTLLSGCATPTPPILLEHQYVTPSGQEDSLATLVGSQEVRVVDSNAVAYVSAIDNKHVMPAKLGWNKLLPIQPGLRNVTVVFTGGVLDTQIDLQLLAVAGGSYQVQFRWPTKGLIGRRAYVDLWIVDMATQKPVTEIRRAKFIFMDEPMRMTI